MSKYERLAGTVDVSIDVFFFTIATGAPVTVTTATAGLDIDYRRPGALNQNMPALSNLTALTDAHADGGILLIGNGVHRLDLPDAACAVGATHVEIHGGATGIAMVPVQIDLVAYNPFDGVRMGLSSLPQSSPGAPGGMPLYENMVLGELVTVATATSGGDFTLSGAAQTNYAKRPLLFLDGPNAFRAQLMTTFTDGTHRCQFTGLDPLGGTDSRYDPFPATPVVGNSALLIGVPSK